MKTPHDIASVFDGGSEFASGERRIPSTQGVER
jgi:hypothetical protein